MTRFDRAYERLRVHEGGYVNHPADPGGATNFGITQRTYSSWRARRNRPFQDVRHITPAEVKSIYRFQYWDMIRADEMPNGVAYCVFDAAVNSGPKRAVQWAQRIIRVDDDGIVGLHTLRELNNYPAVTFINQYCDMRLAFMRSLRHWRHFKNGWTARVSDVRKTSIDWVIGAPDNPKNEQHAVTPKIPRAVGRQTLSALIGAAIAGVAGWFMFSKRGKK